jgi:hypothetical protein
MQGFPFLFYGFPPNVISDLSTGNPGIKVGEERLFLFLEKSITGGSGLWEWLSSEVTPKSGE